MTCAIMAVLAVRMDQADFVYKWDLRTSHDAEDINTSSVTSRKYIPTLQLQNIASEKRPVSISISPTNMHNMLVTSTLAFSTTLIGTAYPFPEALSQFAPAPTSYLKRDSDDYRRNQDLSDALASATSALAEHPTRASSIYDELREEYGTILGDFTGCDSSRWARVTNAIGDIDEDGLIDGIENIVDGLFGDDDEEDECSNEENAGAMSSASIACFGALAVSLFVACVLL